MHMFGLTGGIASGKSTVAARFRARGVPVVDADQVARDVVAVGSDGLAALVLRFGPGILEPGGALDRKKLGAIAFADPEARTALNAIVHPRIGARSAELRQALVDAGHTLSCYEAALLVENGLAAAFAPLVVVATSEAVQVARVMRRDQLDETAARQRLAAQTSLEAKRAAAAFVIENDADLPSLLAHADATLDAICERLGLPKRS